MEPGSGGGGLMAPWWLLPIVLALFTGLLCPLAGTLLLVQRRLFQANLISHAVLPGLAVAVALRVDPALGGVVSGVAGALLAERLSRPERPGESGDEAVLNIVLAGFLGLGVLLIPLLRIRVNLEAVLFGDLLAASPADLVRTLVALAAVLALLAARYHQLVFVGVDPLGAASAGLPVRRLRLLLTLVTALTVVSAMTAVGVVLVIALMAAPALLALEGARSLRQALLRAAATGTVLAGGGFWVAIQPAVNLPPGPLIGVLSLGALPLAALSRRRSPP
jgi:zinc/manganese transport system permease protein